MDLNHRSQPSKGCGDGQAPLHAELHVVWWEKVGLVLNTCMPTLIHKQCLHCNAEFSTIPREKDKKYCSIQCVGISRRKKTRLASCLQCGTEFTKKGSLKFCNSSCAATYNNSIRSTESRAKQAKTLRIRFPKKIKIPRIKTLKTKMPRIKHCASCDAVLDDNHKKYCLSCYGNIRHYRSLAKFTFNVFDYPDEFNLELVNMHGWFSPNGYKRRNKDVNLNGVSRDHMFTIADGFRLGIDPRILAHPANCKVMIHNGPGGNNAKKYSSITYQGLMKRISDWDHKYS